MSVLSPRLFGAVPKKPGVNSVRRSVPQEMLHGFEPVLESG